MVGIFNLWRQRLSEVSDVSEVAYILVFISHSWRRCEHDDVGKHDSAAETGKY